MACKAEIGDECEVSTDCSATGDRLCDTTQPGGYCTIRNCEPGSCTDEGVCVRFKPDDPRLSINWCMAKCGDTGDCDRDEYVCRSADQLNAGDAGSANKRRAEVLDTNNDAKFCIVRE